MWEYIKKVIEYIFFSFLIEAVIIVAKLSCEGIIDVAGKGLTIALFVAPSVLASLAGLSLVKVQRRRQQGRYEKEPISVAALVVLIAIVVIGVILSAIGANVLTSWLYSL